MPPSCAGDATQDFGSAVFFKPYFLPIFICLHFVCPLFSCGSDSPLKVSFRGGWGPGPPASIGDLALASQAAASHLCLVVLSALSLRCVWVGMCPSWI